MTKRTRVLVLSLFVMVSGALVWLLAGRVPRPGGDAVGLVDGGGPAGGSATSRSVRVGYQQIALYRHVFTAASRDFFKEEGLEVELKPFVSANQMMEALLAGNIDATGLTNLEVALSVQGKDPGRFAFANMLVWREKSYPDYVVVRKGVEVRALRGLEGRTVGLHPGSAVKAFAVSLLKGEKVEVGKVRFLEMKPDTMQAALVAGRVDALYCLDPVATTLASAGEARVLVANPMQRIFPAPVPIAGTALATAFVRRDPESARRLVRALERSIQHLREPGHEDEVAGYIAKFTPISKDLALKMNPSEYWTLAEVDRSRVQALADRFHELGIAGARLDVGPLLLPTSFLEAHESPTK